MSDQQSLRVGFIGTGWPDRVQIPAFQLSGLQARAIASGHLENARSTASKYDIPEVYEDWRELLASPTVDIVSIATPPDRHAEMAIAALQAGKHVVCEKPTALNGAEAEEMLAAAQAAPDQLAIIDHELRFTPQRQAMRQLFRDNYVGRAVWVELTWSSSSRLSPRTPWSWWSDAGRGGGVLGAIGSHLLDLSRWMFGRIESLNAVLMTGIPFRENPATGEKRRVTSDDIAHVDLSFNNGINGTITANAVSTKSNGMTVEIYGTHGVLRLDESDRLWGMAPQDSANHEWTNHEWEEIQIDDPVRDMKELPGTNAFARGSVYLGRAIAQTLSQDENWIAEAASFYDGFKVQQMIDQARASHESQQWIRL